jgi:hypothetical protein
MTQHRTVASRSYFLLSVLCAVLAIILASDLTVNPFALQQQQKQQQQNAIHNSNNNNKISFWLFKSIMKQEIAKEPIVTASVPSWIDASLHTPVSTTQTITELLDKILSSTPRLLVMANLFLCMTYGLHTAIANCFLSSATAADNLSMERICLYLIFHMLLASAVVAPDALDTVILSCWYTCLGFLRSLAYASYTQTNEGARAGQDAQNGVFYLLMLVFVLNAAAALVCWALFHSAGVNMMILLTWDCANVATFVVKVMLLHAQQGWELRYARTVERVQQEQLQAASDASRQNETAADNQHEIDVTALAEAPAVDQTSTTQQQQLQPLLHLEDSSGNLVLEQIERSHMRWNSLIDNTVAALQLATHLLTVAHMLHVWSLHGFQWSLIDGVLALHMISGIVVTMQTVKERANAYRIARDLHGAFPDATPLELRKANNAKDVCSICLGGLTTKVKKIGCGHLFHACCLREVVKQARSMEAARCPLCRALVMNGSHAETRPPQVTPAEVAIERAGLQQQVAGIQQQAGVNGRVPDQALFRFSTGDILPAWVPLPALSFEVLRAPAAVQARPVMQNDAAALLAANVQPALANQHLLNRQQLNQEDQHQSFLRRLLIFAGAHTLTPEEEDVALGQLVDMFPQYDRGDLLRGLRDRGSAESVAESILIGSFVGIPRRAVVGNWQP